MGVSKNRGTPKWMVYNGNPIKMDDLGGKPIIFGNIQIENAILKTAVFLEEAAIPVHLTHDLESSKFGERARLPIVQGPFIKLLGQTSI